MNAVALRKPRTRRWPLMRVTRDGLAYGLMWLFFVLTLVLPAAPFNKLVFVVLFGWMALELLFARRPPVALVPAAFLVQGILLYGFVLSLANDVDRALALQFVMSTLVLFLIHFIRHHRIDMDRLVICATVVLLAATFVFEATYAWPSLPLAPQIQAYLLDYGLGAYAEREFGGEPTISVHLGTVPFLFVGFCLVTVRVVESWRWRWIFFLAVVMAGVAMSASRGLWAVSLLFFAFAMMQRVRMLVRLVLVLLALPLVYIAIDFLFEHTLLLSTDEVSNAGKLGHLMSFFDDLTLASLVFGRGLASYYFSTGSMAFKAHTEITPLDMVRYLGLVLAFMMYLVILFPTARLRQYAERNVYWMMAMLLYVVLSATNPVMFNSYGLLVVLWYWARLLPPARE